jgi:hydroxymethylpyrimidine/phosphomethylpyrimidine kinase
MEQTMELSQAIIQVSDLDAACDFYRRLGLVQIIGGHPAYARFRTTRGRGSISLLSTISSSEETALVSASRGATMIYLECDDLDATSATLVDSGISLSDPIRDNPFGTRMAAVTDPDGNRIGLFEDKGDYRLNPPWRLGPEGKPLASFPQ